jgi:hypothetical protein
MAVAVRSFIVFNRFIFTEVHDEKQAGITDRRIACLDIFMCGRIPRLCGDFARTGAKCDYQRGFFMG